MELVPSYLTSHHSSFFELWDTRPLCQYLQTYQTSRATAHPNGYVREQSLSRWRRAASVRSFTPTFDHPLTLPPSTSSHIRLRARRLLRAAGARRSSVEGQPDLISPRPDCSQAATFAVAPVRLPADVAAAIAADVAAAIAAAIATIVAAIAAFHGLFDVLSGTPSQRQIVQCHAGAGAAHHPSLQP